jgi:hypothetical protein
VRRSLDMHADDLLSPFWQMLREEDLGATPCRISLLEFTDTSRRVAGMFETASSLHTDKSNDWDPASHFDVDPTLLTLAVSGRSVTPDHERGAADEHCSMPFGREPESRIRAMRIPIISSACRVLMLTV